MKVIYDLRQDEERIRTCQEATLNTDAGLKPTHGLFGSPEWWQEIERGHLPLHVTEGRILELSDGPMGDWPVVRVETDGGMVRSWTAYAPISPQAIGARIIVETVMQEAKKPPFPGYMSEVLVRMLVDV